MEITEEQIYELMLTDKQKLAAKAVYKAMRAASKLGVSFWDNYGTLTAYNSTKIVVPFMVDHDQHEYDASEDHFDATSDPGMYVLYYENLNNFFPGNSDDKFYAKII